VLCGRLPQVYEPFYADFGPLNMGRTFRFCEITARLLKVRLASTYVAASHWTALTLGGSAAGAMRGAGSPSSRGISHQLASAGAFGSCGLPLLQAPRMRNPWRELVNATTSTASTL
jgi:hypothetical protein